MSITKALEAELLRQARQVLERAYAPYSNFNVGAALLTADGTIFTGCNVECSAYPLGLCAERTAIGSAVTAGHRDFTAIAIATQAQLITPPCGACRQFMGEFSPDMIVLYGNETEVFRTTVSDLLPRMFTPDHLG